MPPQNRSSKVYIEKWRTESSTKARLVNSQLGATPTVQARDPYPHLRGIKPFGPTKQQILQASKHNWTRANDITKYLGDSQSMQDTLLLKRGLDAKWTHLPESAVSDDVYTTPSSFCVVYTPARDGLWKIGGRKCFRSAAFVDERQRDYRSNRVTLNVVICTSVQNAGLDYAKELERLNVQLTKFLEQCYEETLQHANFLKNFDISVDTAVINPVEQTSEDELARYCIAAGVLHFECLNAELEDTAHATQLESIAQQMLQRVATLSMRDVMHLSPIMSRDSSSLRSSVVLRKFDAQKRRNVYESYPNTAFDCISSAQFVSAQRVFSSLVYSPESRKAFLST